MYQKKIPKTRQNFVFYLTDFDSINGNFDKVIDGKIYRTGILKNSVHHDLWNESLQILNSMYFINPNTKRTSSQPRTLKNWTNTIRGNQNCFKI